MFRDFKTLNIILKNLIASQLYLANFLREASLGSDLADQVRVPLYSYSKAHAEMALSLCDFLPTTAEIREIPATFEEVTLSSSTLSSQEEILGFFAALVTQMASELEILLQDLNPVSEIHIKKILQNLVEIHKNELAWLENFQKNYKKSQNPLGKSWLFPYNI